MSISTIFSLIIAEITLVATLRVIYVVRNEAVRKKVLDKHRAKQLEPVYEMYEKIYSWRFAKGLILLTIGQSLHVASNLIQGRQGEASLLGATLGFVALIPSAAGLFIVWKITKAVKRP